MYCLSAKIKTDELYSRIFPLNPGLSAISVLETGEHLDVNKAWLEAMGYRRAEVIGKTAHELHIWEKGDESRQKIIQELAGKGKIENFEARIRTKDKRLLDIIVCAEVIEYMGIRLAVFASHDVTLRKQTQNELIIKNKYLEQANIALRSMLESRDAERRAIEETIFLNIKQYILPYLEEFEKQNLKDENLVAINLMRASIDQLMSSTSRTLFSIYADFTPMEVKVADLVKQGLRTKEISRYLNIAPGSVSTYRNGIRKKLKLCNSKTNLQVYLKSFHNRP